MTVPCRGGFNVPYNGDPLLYHLIIRIEDHLTGLGGGLKFNNMIGIEVKNYVFDS